MCRYHSTSYHTYHYVIVPYPAPAHHHRPYRHRSPDRPTMSASEHHHRQAERPPSPMDVEVPEAPVVPPRPSDFERWLPRRGRSRPSSPPHPPPVVPPQASASRVEEPSPILFYHRHEPYFEFTNFAPYPIHWHGHTYPTAEHLFQAHKFMTTRPDVAEHIRHLPGPRDALEEAGRLRRFQRPDWFDVNVGIMDQILEAKFFQHPRLRDMLLGTGNSMLIEDSPVDSFWGWGADSQGRNELGKALMQLRDRLRHAHGHL
ncbi:uncharacterized protein C8Q71DRAFT_787502 [Rhodofomes roseus]|uniref:NADAR domain-containing protein n=1 Tax=Rhodofomes roseus TaxID=34475 RepID=A0ABQ8K0K4_9APHY|nr:uncharacterized protein C8Q71DRAFT_787502 [Rhodofomes roseus]KAH9830132.1 hypothetical protein C8Q71DRAFT_787502 [Rhodofomes roseus]